ncbi:MAG: flagellar M-ring protein FliF [Desulfuromonas sp.]|uniref:flagellar basal-body MS-ring/collar protein FliF n=1 Tax=Desulfuromonas sp. TaxID=892 RepID=UPI000CA8185A|nr:flagellar basal-body MS-ring/collar protein FliF [Desulfuromonas sp.]PLX84500.1 MAG: flagellar M-ring protein FliF [Desulfuromonas sp.]
MAEDIKNQEGWKNLVDTIKAWPLPRKLALAVTALACLAGFAVIGLQAGTPDYRLLYGGLAEEDAAEVVAWLKESKTPYRLEDAGRSIHIPADLVYESRLALAGAGLPQGGGVGFEIFDQTSFGITDFAQKINLQRAQQGELSRTIASLAPVEAARVHLALPSKRLFKEQQKEATASVILKLAVGRELKEDQVQGIVHLVAGSIEGLPPENITVIDASGRVLTKRFQEEMVGSATPGMLEYQQTLEGRLESRAQALLDRALGPGNSLVQATATVDFSQQEMTEETYDPEATVVRSEQSSREKSGSESSGGVPGVESNLNQEGGFAASVPTSRNEETVNYEVSKVVSRKVFPVGTLKQLSVAVLVADRRVPAAEGGEGGETAWAPRKEEELASIESMVRSALGLDAGRGDQLEVVSMPFENIFEHALVPEPETAGALERWLPALKYGLLALSVVLLYLLVVRPLVRSMRSEDVEESPMKTVEELEKELEGQMAGQQSLPEVPQDPLFDLREQVINEHRPFAQIIKGWLKEG